MLPHGHAHTLDPTKSCHREPAKSTEQLTIAYSYGPDACETPDVCIGHEKSVSVTSAIFRSLEFQRHLLTVGLPPLVRLSTVAAPIYSEFASQRHASICRTEALCERRQRANASGDSASSGQLRLF